MQSIVVILHNIRSTHNVGSVFRTADAVGVSKIYLTGYTPAPIDEFKRERKDISKVSLGAEKNVPWKKVEILSTLENLKSDGYSIVALEQSLKSVDYKKIKISGKTVIILGNEVGGIEESILKKCDQIAEIPMKGKKESLNVSVAAGIFLFRLLDKF